MLGGNRSQLLLFGMHAILLLLALLHLQPLQRPLSYAAWSWFLQLAVFKYAYKVEDPPPLLSAQQQPPAPVALCCPLMLY